MIKGKSLEDMTILNVYAFTNRTSNIEEKI